MPVVPYRDPQGDPDEFEHFQQPHQTGSIIVSDLEETEFEFTGLFDQFGKPIMRVHANLHQGFIGFIPLGYVADEEE